MPTGYTFYNIDGLVPFSTVSYVTNAWVTREDFKFNTADTCAFSTSYYAPTGTANDYMVTVPITLGANPSLNWNSVTYDPQYPDGYEVKVSTSNTQASVVGGTVVYSVTPALSDTLWTNHTVSLAGFANQTVYISFHNNTLDGFLLLIDDILVTNTIANDLSAVSAGYMNAEYTAIPLSQVNSPFALNAKIKNAGSATATNVKMNLTVKNLNTNTVVHTTTTNTLASLAAGATSANLTAVANYTPNAVGAYLAEFITSMTQVDGNHANDTVQQLIFITDSTYARDDATITGEYQGSLGVGAGAAVNGVLGQNYQVNNSAQITSVDFYLAAPTAGDVTSAVIYSVNAATGVPIALLGQTSNYTITTADTLGVFLTLKLQAPVSIAANTKFFVGVREGANNVTIATTNQIFTTNTTFVDWTTAAIHWNNNEDYNFLRTYLLRPNLSPVCSTPITATTTTTQTNCGQATGTATVNPTGGANYSYSWSNGQTSQAAINLAAGTYSCVITTPSGCITTTSATVTNIPLNVGTTSTATACGQSTGTATASVTGTVGTFTYSWSNGQTTQTATGLPAGAHIVFVTSSNGCSGTATASVSSSNGPVVNVTSTNPTCAGTNNGSACATATGTGLTYLWNTTPPQTTACANNLAGGTYSVSVTNANLCTTTQNVTVTAPSAITATTSGTNVACNGTSTGSVAVLANGGTGTLTYSWSPISATTATVNNLPAGTYTCVVKDANNCTQTVSATLTQPAAPLGVVVTVTGSTGVNGTATANVTGGTPGYTYSWSPSAATTQTISNLAPGQYCVYVIDQNGCTQGPTCAQVIGVAIEPSAIGIASLNIYPNPNKGNFTADVVLQNVDDIQIVVFDLNGKQMLSDKQHGDHYNKSISMEGYAKGVYLLEVSTSKGATYHKVVID